MFSGGIEMGNWLKMGYQKRTCKKGLLHGRNKKQHFKAALVKS